MRLRECTPLESDFCFVHTSQIAHKSHHSHRPCCWIYLPKGNKSFFNPLQPLKKGAYNIHPHRRYYIYSPSVCASPPAALFLYNVACYAGGHIFGLCVCVLVVGRHVMSLLKIGSIGRITFEHRNRRL